MRNDREFDQAAWLKAEYEKASAENLAKNRAAEAARRIRPCGCECCSGGFCGGCGHAGCGGR
jgi:hypothetical protein